MDVERSAADGPTRRRADLVILTIAVGILAIAGWRALIDDDPRHVASPEVIEGWSIVFGPAEDGMSATYIACCSDERGGTEREGYGIDDAHWRDLSPGGDGSWFDEPFRGRTCLDPGTEQPLRLGVVQVEPVREAPGRPVVVWYECLGPGVPHEG
jgi:hypothetical protein